MDVTDANILDWNDADLEFKALSGQLNVDEAQGIVECFVAAIGNKDSVGDIVASGAFDGSLRRRKPRVVWGHDWNQPIGKVLAIEEVPASDPRLPAKMKAAGVGGLLARVQFNLKSERGREAFNSVAFFGGDQEWSIGYKTLKADYDPERQANVLKEVELFEVSPVLHGANQLTGTISIKAANGKDRIDSFAKSQWPMFDRSFAERIKNDHPKIWDAGGNIKGDDQYTILTKIAEQGGKARTEDQIKALELREAWIARHKGDFRLPGVIAQVKWLAIGTRGEGHMKKTINDAVAKMNTKSHGMWDDDEPDMHMLMGERRVPMFIHADGMGRIVDGDDIHTVDISRFHGANSHLADERPNIGQAISTHVGAPIQLRLVEDNFVIFDMDVDDDGDDDSFFLPYHFESHSGRYMFGSAMPVEMEYDLHFGDDDDDEYGEYEDEDGEYWADEYHAEMKAIGDPIGPKGPQYDPNSTVDHDGDGRIFDGTPNERAAPKKRPKNQGNGGIPYGNDAVVPPVTRKKKPGKGPMGPAGPHSPGSRATDPEFDAARRRLLRMRRDINERGSMPGGERAAGEQMRQIGAFLRAAEANDRARNGMPTGPAGPDGPNAMVDRLRAEQRRRDAVRKLERRRDEINRRGSTPSGERAAGREMRQVGEFLRAAEQNEWVRERQVANRAIGPAGPQRPGGGVQSHRTRNGIEMSWDKRGRVKSADINDYTEYDPAATLDDLAGDD